MQQRSASSRLPLHMETRMSCPPAISAEEVITFIDRISPLIGRAKTLAEASPFLDGEPDALPCCIAILEPITELMQRADAEVDRLSAMVRHGCAEPQSRD